MPDKSEIRKTVIAIDPDIDKSGLAFFDGITMEVSSVSFPLLLDKVRDAARHGNAEVYVEAGWLNEGNWHLPYGTSAAKAAAIGRGVGRNHETGRKIVECLRYYGIVPQEIKPLKKFWRGKDHKITQEELNKLLASRNIPVLKRCSQDARDAALIALAYYD